MEVSEYYGKYITSPSGLATTLNKYFINKVKNLRPSNLVANIDPFAKLQESMAKRQCSFKVKPVSQLEVLAIITSLNNSSATGVQTMKLVKHEVVGAVTRVINMSIQSSTFPHINKKSQIIPLKKKPTVKDLDSSSYRPANLLPIPETLLEKAVF